MIENVIFIKQDKDTKSFIFSGKVDGKDYYVSTAIDKGEDAEKIWGLVWGIFKEKEMANFYDRVLT